jgi:hypothetical protein
MNRTDKRNFKLLTQLTSGDKKYLRLFDAIDRQSVYDEDKLLHLFRNDPMVKQFSVSKNYLYNNILRSLVFFFQGKNQDLSTTNIQVAILADKNLQNQAMKLLRKAKLRASQVEDFNELLQLLGSERKILKNTGDFRGLEQRLEEIQAEETETEAKRCNELAYQHLWDRMETICLVHRHARVESDRQAMLLLLGHDLMASESAAICERSRALYFRIRGWAMVYLDQRQEAWEMSHARSAIFAESRKFREANNEQHVVALREEGERLLELSRYEQWKVLQKELLKLPVFTEAARLSQSIGLVLLQLQFAVQTGKLEEGEKAVKEFQALLAEEGKRIGEADCMQFYGAAGCLSFVGGQNAAALKWITAFLDMPRTDLRQDLQCYARLTLLLIHYELEHIDLLDSNLKSTGRFIFKRNRMYRPERMVMRAIRLLMQQDEGGSPEQVFQEMLGEMKKETAGRFDNPAFRSMYLEVYFKSKLAQTPMAELLNDAYHYQSEGEMH